MFFKRMDTGMFVCYDIYFCNAWIFFIEFYYFYSQKETVLKNKERAGEQRNSYSLFQLLEMFLMLNMNKYLFIYRFIITVFTIGKNLITDIETPFK